MTHRQHIVIDDDDYYRAARMQTANYNTTLSVRAFSSLLFLYFSSISQVFNFLNAIDFYDVVIW